MDDINEKILEGLSDNQSKAVTHDLKPLLVIAGPGSGKTRVMAHRIPWIVNNFQINPNQILAVTFTNKAAKELMARANRFLPNYMAPLVKTFHGFSSYFLRIEGFFAGLDQSFSIYDDTDQIRIIKNIFDELDLNPRKINPKVIAAEISKAKNKGFSPNSLKNKNSSYFDEIVSRIYSRYQEIIDQSNACDFDDLLMKTKMILVENEDIKEKWASKYKQVIIDEFQRMFQDQSVMSQVEKLFDDLNRRGRAFGIHFVLATQSIYDLNMTPATLSQLSIRICLKISEMDASKILHVDNLIPATFDKPGKAIYNNNIGLVDSNLQMQVPFIDSTKIKNTILEIANKNKIKTENHISKGQQFEVFDSSLIENKNSVTVGSLQDIKKTYFNINIDPKAYSPLLILGNEKQKLKLLFNSFVRDHVINNKNINVLCLDFHPLNMDNVSSSLLKKDKIYKYSNNEKNFFEYLIEINKKSLNSKKINLLLILGLDESLSFKENITDDIGSQTDNKTKENLLKIIRERLSLNIIPIVFLRKLSNFSSVFDSLIYENSISSDVFSRRIYMDTPQEFNYDYGNLSKYKVFYHDLEKSTQQILTIFE